MVQTDANEGFEMSRGTKPSAVRCLAVWLLVSTVALGSWSAVGDAAASMTSAAVWHGTFEDLLVAVASAALIACSCWLWVITTATVADVLRGREPGAAPRGGLTRRLVLIACGVAVVAGVGSPALAEPSAVSTSGDHSMVGLPMPDRAVVGVADRDARPAPVTADRPAQRRTAKSTADPAAITVRAGDSLWSIAAARLGPDADVSEIDAAWRALYAANRDAIGSDADLILPGLDLEQGIDSNRKAPR